MTFMRSIILLATVGMASGFVAPASNGMILRSAAAMRSPLAAAPSLARVPRKVIGGASMHMQELSDSAMLLAAAPAVVKDGLTAYMNLYVPIFKSLNLPTWMLHWFHGLNMGTVLFGMGGYGTYLGWSIRGDPKTAGKLAGGPGAFLGKTSSELHSSLMGAMALIFFLGANGGLVLSLVQDKPITESAHFTTAMAGFALLAAQASITKLFNGENNQNARTAHAVLGSGTMVVFIYHAYLGLQLGLSL